MASGERGLRLRGGGPTVSLRPGLQPGPLRDGTWKVLTLTMNNQPRALVSRASPNHCGIFIIPCSGEMAVLYSRGPGAFCSFKNFARNVHS